MIFYPLDQKHAKFIYQLAYAIANYLEILI
jgi:hypothetical protein